VQPWNELVRGTKIFTNQPPPGAFTLNAWRQNDLPIEASDIQDIIVVCHYTV